LLLAAGLSIGVLCVTEAVGIVKLQQECMYFIVMSFMLQTDKRVFMKKTYEVILV